MTEAQALNAIQALLDGRSWSAETTELIAVVVRATGRSVRDPMEKK
jgi:hypothetical protein